MNASDETAWKPGHSFGQDVSTTSRLVGETLVLASLGLLFFVPLVIREVWGSGSGAHSPLESCWSQSRLACGPGRSQRLNFWTGIASRVRIDRIHGQGII